MEFQNLGNAKYDMPMINKPTHPYTCVSPCVSVRIHDTELMEFLKAMYASREAP